MTCPPTMPTPPNGPDRTLVAAALERLGKKRLVLAIHDASFPSLPEEDVGRGSPYSRGASALVRFVHELGFTGLLLGPQGQTSAVNASPYDGTAFSKSVLSLALGPLAANDREGLYSQEQLETLVRERPEGPSERVAYDYVWRGQMRALDEIYDLWRARRAIGDRALDGLGQELDDFRSQNREWLTADALYSGLSYWHRSDYWPTWRPRGSGYLDRELCHPEPGTEERAASRRAQIERLERGVIERHELGQFLLQRQHAELRRELGAQGLKLYGDLQIGLSAADRWAWGSLFLRDYFMGAPPSRTNPEGQPWSYPVLDPRQYRNVDGTPGPVLQFVALRMRKMLSEFDGVRIDHPHGLVCPWVYKADVADSLWAVQHGARLFESPALPDHPLLAAFSIARREQHADDGVVARYADDWVRELDDQQVARYSELVEVIMQSATAHGRERSDIIAEVLSTLPYPLRRVLERYGLGRFRVTQKANLADANDVYRSENAEPPDWIMLGNHDTKPIWLLADEWRASGAIRGQAAYLAGRLTQGRRQGAFARKLVADGGRFVHAKLADLLLSRAENVMVFFSDLFGLREVYNAPGTVSPDNWSLRLTHDFAQRYRERSPDLQTLNLPYALSMALRALPGASESADTTALARKLEPLA